MGDAADRLRASAPSSASIRRQQSSDLLAKTPGELGGAGGAAPDINGGYAVYEGYGEIIAPIVEDKPFFESLTLEAGIRYSKYEIDGARRQQRPGPGRPAAAGNRAMASRSAATTAKAVRAPNIGELFTPRRVGLTNLAVDPCAGAAPIDQCRPAGHLSGAGRSGRNDRSDYQPDRGPGQHPGRRQCRTEAGKGQDMDPWRGVRAGVPAEVLDVDRLLQHPGQGRYRHGASGRFDQGLLRQRSPPPA